MSRQINIHTCYMYLTDHKQQTKVYQIWSQYLPPLTLKWDGASHESKKKIQTTPDTLICTCICSWFSSDLFLMPSATVWKYVLMNPFEERNWAKSEMKSKISVRKKEQLWCWVCGAEQPGAECSPLLSPKTCTTPQKKFKSLFWDTGEGKISRWHSVIFRLLMNTHGCFNTLSWDVPSYVNDSLYLPMCYFFPTTICSSHIFKYLIKVKNVPKH